MRSRAFSLLEVIVALGVLAVGATAAIALYNSNIRTARQTKDEIIISLLMRDIRAKTQLAAYTAWSDLPLKSTFDGSDWLLRDDAAPDDPGSPVLFDGGGGGGSTDHQSLNGQSWEAIKRKYDALSPLGSRWDDNPLYARWQFRMRTVVPPEVENNQFVDMDGYDIWDGDTRQLLPNIHHDEINDGSGTLLKRTPVKPPASARGTLPPGAVNTGYFGPPRSSHGVAYDPRGMRFHIKRIKCVIGWDLNNSSDIFSGQQHVFYFTVYNPDLRKKH